MQILTLRVHCSIIHITVHNQWVPAHAWETHKGKRLHLVIDLFRFNSIQSSGSIIEMYCNVVISTTDIL